MADQWATTADHAPDPGWASTADHSADQYPGLSSVPGFRYVKPALDLAAGAGGSLATHAVNAYQLLRKIPGADKVLPDPSNFQKAIAEATPDNTPAHVGRFLESATEFAVPAGKVAEATKAAPLLGRMAAQSAVGGGVSALDSGGDPGATATGAAIGATGPLVDSGVEALAPGAKKVTAQVLGRTTGAGPDTMTEAIEKPSPALVKAMRGGTDETEVLGNFRQALQKVKDTRAADYQQALAKLPQNLKVNPTPLQQKLEQLLPEFKISVGKPSVTQSVSTSPVLDAAGKPIQQVAQTTTPGDLDFSRSTITDPQAQRQIKQIVADIRSWGSKSGDLSALGYDTLKQRIGNIVADTADGRAKAFAAGLYDSANGVLKRSVPGYASMVGDYEDASKFIDSLGDLSIDAKNPGTALRKLSTIMRSDSAHRRMLTDALSQYSNVDLKGQLAGMALSQPAPTGLTKYVDMGTGAGLLFGISHGLVNPAAAAAAATASPRLMGELLVAMSKASPALKAAGPALGVGAPAAANAAVNGQR